MGLLFLMLVALVIGGLGSYLVESWSAAYYATSEDILDEYKKFYSVSKLYEQNKKQNKLLIPLSLILCSYFLYSQSTFILVILIMIIGIILANVSIIGSIERYNKEI